MMDTLEVYPVGTRVVHTRFTNLSDTPIYGRVVAEGPSYYGTTVLPDDAMFIALEAGQTSRSGAFARAGTVFVGTSHVWKRAQT